MFTNRSTDHPIRSATYLDDPLNAVRPARYVHTEELARNRLCAECHGFRDDRARLGGNGFG
ncbi:MAG: hypothetical protein J2P52_06900 [Blastocatellia bacterium]|nr:hypothetical protein [Blastocatellia bacterium]